MTDDEDDGRVRHLMSAPEAEAVLRIPQATIRSWHKRKLLYAWGLDHRNKPLFDRDHLVSLRDRRRSMGYYQHQKGPRRLRQQPPTS